MTQPSDCIFCKIVAGEIPATIVHKDDHVTAFRDLHPQAPVHVLLVPNRHLAGVNEAGESDADPLGRLILAAGKIAHDEGIAEKGYRLIINSGRDGGQAVFHLHCHLLGGRRLGRMVG